MKDLRGKVADVARAFTYGGSPEECADRVLTVIREAVDDELRTIDPENEFYRYSHALDDVFYLLGGTVAEHTEKKRMRG